MARSRNIKPGFFANEDLAELGPDGMLLFAGLWTLADRDGRLEDRPKRIKGQLFPYFDFDVDGYLDALQTRGFITRYEVDGARYVQVVNFGKHQSPHIKEGASVIPAPDMHQTSTRLSEEKPHETVAPDKSDTSPVQAPDKHPLIPDSLIPDSLIVDSGLPESGADAPRKAKRAFEFPEDWQPTDKDRAWAVGQGYSAEVIARGTTMCVRHHRGKGNVFKDHSMTWRNWMDREWDFGPARASPNGPASPKRAGPADFARLAGMDVRVEQ